jgi:hypothetical protein
LEPKDIRNQSQHFKTLGLDVSVGQEIEAVKASRAAELLASLALQNRSVVYDILFRPAVDTVQTEAREHPDRQKEARLAGDPAALGR